MRVGGGRAPGEERAPEGECTDGAVLSRERAGEAAGGRGGEEKMERLVLGAFESRRLRGAKGEGCVG